MIERRQKKARTVKRKSLRRSLKSVKSLGDIAVQEGLSIVPGGALSYRLVKVLVSHARRYFSDRTKTRLEQFHERLLEGIPPESQAELLKSRFSVEDYYSLLSHAVQDEEDKKVDMYAKILRGLVVTAVASEIRLHIVKAVRELKHSDFDLMRQLYINGKFELIGSQTIDGQIEAITRTDDPLKASTIENLVRLGFLSGQARPPKPTKLLYEVTELVFEDKDLTPESVGRKRKTIASEMSTVWIAYDGLDEHDNVQILIGLSRALSGKDISSIIANPIRPARAFPPTAVLALCVGAKGSPIENARKFIGFEGKLVIGILLPGAEREKWPIERAPIFDFTGNKDRLEETMGFVQMVTEEVKKRGFMTSFV